MITNIRKHRAAKRLPVIKCECGTEILLVPDAKAMRLAIDKHANAHGQKMGSLDLDENEVERVRDDLIAKVLAKASELG